MGIVCNALAIFAGGAVGAVFSRRIRITRHMLQILGICVMFLAFSNIAANSLTVSNGEIKTHNITAVVISVLIGTFIGECAGIDGRLKIGENTHGRAMTAFSAGTMLFGIGGLQVSGAISQVVMGDSSVLLTKCIVDMPLAVSFGAAMGIGVAYSALPVALMQLAIGFAAAVAKEFMTPDFIAQLNVIGYLILFFTGFNMLFDGTTKVKCSNMLPSLGVAAAYNIIMMLTGVAA